MDGTALHAAPHEGYSAEREHLVRLCAYLSGSPEAAEDLAQEALVEAWRHEEGLRDPSRRSAWLAGIARNVCRRWLRSRGRELRIQDEVEERHGATLDLVADGTDLEVDLERTELALLLDRAMALLGPETRAVLVGRFVDDLSHAEIGERLSLSEGTVKVRVHRGKLTLRRLLATHFAGDLEAYGYAPEGDGWRETRIWCSSCGTHRLLMRTTEGPDVVSFRCPHCHADPGVTSSEFPLDNPQFASLIGGLARPATILKHTAEWSHEYYCHKRTDTLVPCTRCGQMARVQMSRPGHRLEELGCRDGMYVSCKACGEHLSVSREGLVMALPDVQRFWRERSRIRILPGREIEIGGRPAIVTRVESVTSAALVDVVTGAESFGVIGVHPGSMTGVDLSC